MNIIVFLRARLFVEAAASVASLLAVQKVTCLKHTLICGKVRKGKIHLLNTKKATDI